MQPRLCALLLAAAIGVSGCGLLYPFASQETGDGAATDGLAFRDTGTDGAFAMACVWGPFGKIEELKNVNSSNDDWAPYVSRDGLALYFHSYRRGSNNFDIYVARRSDLKSDFGDAQKVSVSGSGDDREPAISPDGKRLVFTIAPGKGGRTSADLVESRRDTSGSKWGPRSFMTSIINSYWESRPSFSPDGQELYFSTTGRGGKGSFEIVRAERAATGDTYATPKLVSELNSTADDRMGAVSSDNLELFFSSARSGGKGRHDIWVARRPRSNAPWGPPQKVAELNTTYDDVFPVLAADGTTIYFNRNASLAGSPSHRANIWRATRSCTTP